MYKGFCHTCQEFLETPNKFCEKCGMMLEIIQRIEPVQNQTSVFNPNTNINSANTTPNQMPESVVNTAFNSQNTQANSGNNFHSPTPNQNNNSQSDNQTFQRKYSANPRNYNQTNYTQNNNFSAQIESPSAKKTIVKFLLIAVVLCGLGFGVNYAKNYFAAMPEQRINAILKGDKANNTAQTSVQKPWFNGWFRKEPTAEEIFEKYEDVTNIKDKDFTSQTMIIKGKVKLTPVEVNRLTNPINPFDKFDIDMEMSMKLPDKILAKVDMTLKTPQKVENDISSYIKIGKESPTPVSNHYMKSTAYICANGNDKWMLTNTFLDGDTSRKEKDGSSNDVDDSFKETDALNMTLNRKMYASIELSGTDMVKNRKAYLIKATKPNGNFELLYFDIETGLIIKYLSKNAEIFINAYNTFGDVKMPSQVEQKIKDMQFNYEVTDIQKDVPLEDSIFLRSSY